MLQPAEPSSHGSFYILILIPHSGPPEVAALWLDGQQEVVLIEHGEPTWLPATANGSAC